MRRCEFIGVLGGAAVINLKIANALGPDRSAGNARDCRRGDRMRRREFITLLGAAAVAWPIGARAQQVEKIYRIGILEPIPAARNAANLGALRKGLRNLGYVEGQNLVIEYRSADGRAERFPDLASELVGLNVALILARGTPATTAVQSATGTIPVVMMAMGGPGALVASFARPS